MANYEYVAQMMDFCEENNIKSFAELCRYARRERREWFRVICNDAEVMVEYLKSKREE